VSEVAYRRARAGLADGAAVAAVFGAARAQMTYLPVLHTAEEDRAFFTDRVIGSGSHDVTVVEVEVEVEVEVDVDVDVEGEIVAFSAVCRGWIEHLYVTPAWQGRGIGSALLARAMSEHPGGLDLWVFESNVRAAALYARSGFVVVERTDGGGNEERLPDLRMRWGGSGG
jgi:GNAT superfamily N-acetyltransferase